MNIGIVGLGSMGKRRIRLLKKIDESINLVGIDNREDRCKEAKDLYGIQAENDLATAIELHNIDAVIVSTAPIAHHEVIKLALSKHCHVFTEINLIKDGYNENIELAKKNKLILFLSSTFLYRNEVQYIKKLVENEKNTLSYIYHVGQYLPTWHSWENYKDFFVANKKTNGCRELFAIELPWITDVFGDIINFKGSSNKMSTLDIEYPDNYMLVIDHKSGVKGALIIDIVSRKAVRNLEIYAQDFHLEWKGAPDTLSLYDCKEERSRLISLKEDSERINKQNYTIVEDAYENELIEFLAAIDGKVIPRYSFEKDLKILNLIDRLEEEFYCENI